MAIGVFKTKWLARFARRERITDESLWEAIGRAERGIVDADLGGGLIKQRVARERQGRSGGYRMLVAYRSRGRAVFLYGFAKNEQENIGPDELVSLREIAATWLHADAERIAGAVTAKELQEVEHGEAGT
ncbi:type II toxin-antitoxin system RelE/ParE family toxin [Lichenicoccus sp.]|uniref:type II toxin-antitoxin system RelE/ParE family toxin n=1 Tax=Lichenicoccus sp. TaxID=2781899 RepID=UPI003D150A26